MTLRRLVLLAGYLVIVWLAATGDRVPDSVYLAAMVVCIMAATWSAGRPYGEVPGGGHSPK